MINNNFSAIVFSSILSLFLIFGCGPSEEEEAPVQLTWDTVQDSTHRIGIIEGGLQGPESVQYDPGQDLYFISNFNGGATDADSNGFISRANTAGVIDSLKFMTGTEEYPLHSPRGMYIIGDTLFVADMDGVHGFDRSSGEQIHFTNFTSLEPGFLNALAIGPDSALYVTDSSKPRLYRMAGENISIVVDSLPYPNNGITYDESNKRLILAAWNGGENFLTWDPLTSELGEAGSGVGGNYDGIEPLGEGFIVSSQADSTLQLIQGGEGQIFVEVPGRPADIGLDTKRMQVLVPYIALNRVDIWQLPTGEQATR